MAEKELLLTKTTKELTLRKALNYYTLGINMRNKNSKMLKNIQTYLNILHDSGRLLFISLASRTFTVQMICPQNREK